MPNPLNDLMTTVGIHYHPSVRCAPSHHPCGWSGWGPRGAGRGHPQERVGSRDSGTHGVYASRGARFDVKPTNDPMATVDTHHRYVTVRHIIHVTRTTVSEMYVHHPGCCEGVSASGWSGGGQRGSEWSPLKKGAGPNASLCLSHAVEGSCFGVWDGLPPSHGRSPRRTSPATSAGPHDDPQ